MVQKSSMGNAFTRNFHVIDQRTLKFVISKKYSRKRTWELREKKEDTETLQNDTDPLIMYNAIIKPWELLFHNWIMPKSSGT